MDYVTSFWVLCETLSQCFISEESVYILRCLHLYSFESYDSLFALQIELYAMAKFDQYFLVLACHVFIKFFIILACVQIFVHLCYTLYTFSVILRRHCL